MIMSVWVVMLDIISEEMVVPIGYESSRYASGSNNTFLDTELVEVDKPLFPYSSGEYNVAFEVEKYARFRLVIIM